eukprot:4465825-Pyramimonas_sp.AAC.1
MTDASEFGYGAAQTLTTSEECRDEAAKGELQTWRVRVDETHQDIEEEVEHEGEEDDEQIAPDLGRPGVLELAAGVA